MSTHFYTDEEIETLQYEEHLSQDQSIEEIALGRMWSYVDGGVSVYDTYADFITAQGQQ
jgi:hypothetical protein